MLNFNRAWRRVQGKPCSAFCSHLAGPPTSFWTRMQNRAFCLEIMQEVWKAIPGYEGRYEVSDQGRVRSLDRYTKLPTRWGVVALKKQPGKVLSAYVNTFRGGYRQVNLRFDGKQRMHRIARLVLFAFVGPAPENYEACHCDGQPTNDILSNLRWDSRSANQKDRVLHGTNCAGERHPQARLSDAQVECILRSCGDRKLLAKQYGVSRKHIDAIKSGRRRNALA